ncbi:MAG: hypothetical protein K0R14_207 [Burkholderiales bacterium]|jgi:hypothetical protein|nr:hypothetical protein [Burkholderiales bacterium]
MESRMTTITIVLVDIFILLGVGLLTYLLTHRKNHKKHQH